eukprot:XP_001704017.1 Hypothetical protein GL50803_9669 [Giardia lamblia ATCC 50803]
MVDAPNDNFLLETDLVPKLNYEIEAPAANEYVSFQGNGLRQ